MHAAQGNSFSPSFRPSPVAASTWIVPIVIAITVAALAIPSVAKDRVPKRKEAVGMPRLPAAAMEPPSGPVMEVTRIDRGRRGEVRAAAEAIDRLLAGSWKKHEVEPSPKLTDEQFVRRAYLELGGRIPGYDETLAFLGSKARDKRAELVDALLESPDYVSHFYNYWADILRLTERPQKQLPFEPYLDYVKDSIRANKPFDAWVHEMLTADGRITENPAVGFQLRDAGMPLPYVDNTVRVLLGTQIGCAQCHDHPFDQWTQHQFYELAAFTSGTRLRNGPGMAFVKKGKEREVPGRAVRELLADLKERNQPKDNQLRNYIQANATHVNFRPSTLKLPHDYQYDDAKPLDAVEAKVLWGEVPSEARAADLRLQFSAWVVARDNRQFARTIANRLWKKLMGVGIVEPVDDFREENPPSDPELLEHLTDLVLAVDFDLREFVRVIASTDAWQRRAAVHDPSSAEPYRFPGPALKRLTAEQLWDSILVLIVRNPWSVQRPSAAEFSEAFAVDLERSDLATVERHFEDWLDAYGPGRQRRAMATSSFAGQPLVRASELPTPLPLGHFLRQFGQSDRESIEGGRTVATVPQVLAMFNGPITHAMLVPGSVIYDNVTSHSREEAIDVVFLSVLSRRPASDDRLVAVEEIRSAETPATGCGNLIWGLLNTREFLFIQ
jgi:hypothetical protein